MATRATRAYRLSAALYAVLVVAGSSLPASRLPNLSIGHLDKLLHFGQYAIFSFLVAGGWGKPRSGKGRLVEWIPVVVLILFAALDEYHQGWIPGRDPDVGDWAADLVGIICGFWAGTRRFTRPQDAN